MTYGKIESHQEDLYARVIEYILIVDIYIIHAPKIVMGNIIPVLEWEKKEASEEAKKEVGDGCSKRAPGKNGEGLED